MVRSPRLREEVGAAYELVEVDSCAALVERARLEPAPEVAVVDDLAAARALHSAAPHIPVIVISPTPEAQELTASAKALVISEAVQAQWRPGELATAVQRSIQVAKLRKERDALRTSMHRRIDALSILYEVSGATTEVSSHAEILEVIMRALYRIVRFDLGGTILATEDTRGAVLHLHCQQPCDERLLRGARDRCVELYRDLTGVAVDERHLAVHLSGDPMGSPNAIDTIASSTDIPLTIRGRTVGVIYLAAHNERAFSSEDEKLLYFLAHRTSEAVRRLASRIHDERRRLSLMVESMADGLIMTDPHSEIVLINPAARRMLGIEKDSEDVTRQYLKERLGFYPFDLVATRMVMPSSDEDGLVREELKIAGKVLHSIVSPVRDGAGKLVGVVVVLRDITEAKELDRRKEEFVSVVSHELRTPLTSVTGALDIVLKEYVGQVSEKQRRYLQMARDSCAKLNVVIDDVLDVARSERGRMPMRFRPLSLDELSAEIVERYRAAAEAKDIGLQLTLEGEDIRIVGDPDRLTQVLNNLLSNAIKFTPSRGYIDVAVFGPSVASSHVGVSVFNNGDPIPDQARERVFDKFEQIQESSTRRVGGTGLGLAISRAIIEAHGGRIWVDPREDGTKFVFTLPSAPADGAEPASDVESDATAELDSQESGATILIACQDEYTTFILKGVLMAAGHDVIVARDVDQALNLARQHSPALAVVDAGSLADEAPALVEIIKHDPETKKAAVLVIDGPHHRERTRASGADEVIAKPIEAEQFRRTCNRLIREAGTVRAARILIADDDAAIRMICREVLARAGYNVREAEDGNQALVEAKRFRPDLMLLDVMMPDLDGFQTAQRFRSDSASSLTPVIFLSARGETADKVRAFRLGAEDYMVKPFDAAELVARVEKALERKNRELGASPTTQLPGAGAIETEIERRLSSPGDHAFCYLDLDNLKAFNDYYGYAKADGVIRQTGDLIREVIAREGTPADFIGHIAGDDFVFITRADLVDQVCIAISETFDRLVPLYYNRGDRERGYIEGKDRYGVQRKFPVMSVSLSAVTQRARRIQTFSELATEAARGKKVAKAVVGSSYVRDGVLILGGDGDVSGEGSSEPDLAAGPAGGSEAAG
jgi:PAS domain S-box-containing protein